MRPLTLLATWSAGGVGRDGEKERE